MAFRFGRNPDASTYMDIEYLEAGAAESGTDSDDSLDDPEFVRAREALMRDDEDAPTVEAAVSDSDARRPQPRRGSGSSSSESAEFAEAMPAATAGVAADAAGGKPITTRLASESSTSGAGGGDAGDDADDDDDDDDDAAAQGAPDPLYDEQADGRDEAWVNKRRGVTGGRPNRKSDAVLSCPCCFTVLSYDCQRHALYEHQYRAVLVQHCRVVTDQELVLPAVSKRARAKRGRRRGDGTLEGEEVVHPVQCDVCGVEVGVQDKDEIVHFFHVVPGTG